MVRITIMAAACVMLLFPALPAGAFGIGAYGNYSGGISGYVNQKGNYSYHQQAGGGGVMLSLIDSALGSASMEWRFRLGAERLFAELYSSDPAYRINGMNYLYFGSGRKMIFKPSFGPLLGVRYMHGERKWFSYGASNYYNLNTMNKFYPSVQANGQEIDEWAVCVGLSLNFDITPIECLVIFVSINAEHYFLFQKFINTYRVWIIGAPTSMEPLLWNRWKDPRRRDMATEGSISAGVMYRFGAAGGGAAPGGEDNG